MTRKASVLRALVVLGLLAALEAMCRGGIIDRFTMQPPSLIVRDLAVLLAAGKLNAAIAKTFSNAAIGFCLAVSAGIGLFLFIIALEQAKVVDVFRTVVVSVMAHKRWRWGVER